MKIITTIFLLTLSSFALSAYGLDSPSEKSQDIVLYNCSIHPMTEGEKDFKGYVHIRDGKITQVEAGLPDSLSSATIDLHNGVMFPGFIDTHVSGEQVRKSIFQSNPNSLHRGQEPVKTLLHSGVTTIVLRPDSDSFYSGRSQVLCLYPDSLGGPQIISDNFDFQISITERGYASTQSGKSRPYKKMLNYYRLSELLRTTKREMQAELALSENERQLLHYLNNNFPVYFYVNDAMDIILLQKLINEYNLKAYFGGANDIWEVIDLNGKGNIPSLVLGPTFYSRHSVTNEQYLIPAKLTENNIEFAIGSFETDSQWLSLLDRARILTAYGIPGEQAMASITRIPGLQMNSIDKLGVIREGATANLVVFNNHPLQMDARLILIVINGKLVWFEK